VKQRIKYIFIFITIIVLIFWASKQLGFPSFLYGLNTFSSVINGRTVKNKDYSLTLPLFTWRKISDNNNSILLKGITPDSTFVTATISNNYKNAKLVEVEKWCEGKSIINRNILGISITCENEKNQKLRPYKIFWVQGKVFVFMYDYQKEYNETYQNLLDNITFTSIQ